MVWVILYGGKSLYINVYNNSSKIPVSVLIVGRGKREIAELKSFKQRIEKGTVQITLEKDSIIFNSGPKKLKIKIDSNSEIKDIENLLKKDFKMSAVLSEDGHELTIPFSF